MPVSAPAVRFPDPVSYLFIDGACMEAILRTMSKKYFDGRVIEVDYRSFRGNHHKAFYYDAIPVRILHETADAHEARIAPKRTFLDTVARQDGYHVRSGDARRRKKVGQEQKMVDVQLAVDMMSYASRGVFARATLLTGDLDFKPLIDALVDMGVDVTLNYPPNETNSDLILSADRAFPANIMTVYGWTTSAFRKLNQLPHRSSELHSNDYCPYIIRSWNSEEHGQCHVYKKDDLFVVVIDDPLNETHQIHVRDKDQRMLCMFVEDLYGFKVPEF